MAKIPLSQEYIQANLPANLPENWVNDNYLMADDIANPEYGYNYLNKQINETQKSVKLINKAFEDLTPQILHWNLGDNVDIGTGYLSGILDSTTSTSWTNVGTSNQPPSFSVPFEANIVVFISLDCEAFGTASGNDNNGNCMRVTFDQGSGSSIVKYRSLKVAGLDWFSGAKYDQQVRGTIALVESFENQPANTPISISLAHRRIASDWGASSHIGGRSVTYIAYPV